MTEAEMFETIAIYSANALIAFNSYVSFVFGYLAVSYFVGGKLTALQAIVISGLFIISACVAILVCNTQIGPIAEFQLELGSEHDYFLFGNIARADLIRVLLLPLMGFGIFASLYFMFVEYRQGQAEST